LVLEKPATTTTKKLLANEDHFTSSFFSSKVRFAMSNWQGRFEATWQVHGPVQSHDASIYNTHEWLQLDPISNRQSFWGQSPSVLCAYVCL